MDFLLRTFGQVYERCSDSPCSDTPLFMSASSELPRVKVRHKWLENGKSSPSVTPHLSPILSPPHAGRCIVEPLELNCCPFRTPRCCYNKMHLSLSLASFLGLRSPVEGCLPGLGEAVVPPAEAPAAAAPSTWSAPAAGCCP